MRIRPPKLIRAPGRPSLSSLPLPSPRFDLALTPDFETAAKAIAEDDTRSRMIRLRVPSVELALAKRLRLLADRIDPDVTHYPTSPASLRFMLDYRRRTMGGMWQHLDEHHVSRHLTNTSTFTCVPEGWSVPLGQLRFVRPDRRMATFRGQIERVKAQMLIKPDGCLFARLHGAFDTTTNTFPLHIHGIATGGMIDVIDGLRNLGMYRPADPGDGRDAAHTPIRVSRDPLSNMPLPLTYAAQGSWPKRETYVTEDGVRKARQGPRQRICEPAHSEYLLFLDKWAPDKLTLIMGMHVTKSGLMSL